MEFNIIGVDDFTSNSVLTLLSTASDGENIFVGSQNIAGKADVWKFNRKNNWSNITSNLNKVFDSRSTAAIFFDKNKLFVGLSRTDLDIYAGKIYFSEGLNWRLALNQSPSDTDRSNNLAIRKFLKISENIFAAGTEHIIYKFNKDNKLFEPYFNIGDSSDPAQILYKLATYHWLDLETDGLNLYGTCLSRVKTEYFNIVKINNDSTFSEIAGPSSDVPFGDGNNLFINKLCWHNNKLYACTYNVASGCQIHEGTYDSNADTWSWQKINQDGFGSSFNYDVFQIKSIDQKLVVSTNNSKAPEVWVYENSAWEKQNINSQIKYSSYLIQETNHGVYLIGTRVNNLFINDAPEVVTTKKEKFDKKAYFWPYDSIGAIPTSLDNYKFFASNKDFTYISKGPFDALLQSDLNTDETYFSAISDKITALSSVIPPRDNIFYLSSQSIPLDFTGLPGAWTARFNWNRNETNAFSQFPNFTPVQVGTAYDVFTDVSTPLATFYPTYFNSLHMSLIPKGPHRGKVFIMTNNPLVGKTTAIENGTRAWSFQPWAILDPSPSAGTPDKPRFLNFLLPISPSGEHYTKFIERESDPWLLNPSNDLGRLFRASSIGGVDYQDGVNVTSIAWPNFFCAGHTWSPSGDLIMVGGSEWTWNLRTELQKDIRCPNLSRDYLFQLGAPDNPLGVENNVQLAYRYNSLYSLDNSTFLGYKGTYSWNPASVSGSWRSKDYQGQYFSSVTALDHYNQAGCWTVGPDLDSRRWYPTAMLYPRVNGNTNVLVVGGDDQLNNRIVPTYNNYEGLIISSVCTSSDSGIGKRYFNGLSTFSGPSNEDASSFYDSDTSFSSNVQKDGFYFYPRTFILSGGEVTFAGMTHKSSILADYATDPNSWSKTLGYADSGTARNRFRYYPSCFRLPNTDNKDVDVFMRTGGGDIFCNPLSYDPNITTPNTGKVDILNGHNFNNTWEYSPAMNAERTSHNTVLLPDATVFCIGGYFYETAAISPTGRISQPETDYNESVSPFYLLDHHTHLVTSALHGHDHFHAHEIQDISDYVETISEYYEYDSSLLPESQVDPNNPIINGLLFHRFPEILSWNVANSRWEWESYSWAPHLSWRDYHSAALLLPDGRILCAGGEARHAIPNLYLSSTLGIGYDFEIFSPKYLRPTQNPFDIPEKPQNLEITGVSVNNDPEVEAYDLSYGQTYTVSCSPMSNADAPDKVVLMAPGSVTHHSCYSQRYYNCSVTKVNNTTLNFTLPSTDKQLIEGFYMLFVVSESNIPSEAIWVRLVT